MMLSIQENTICFIDDVEIFITGDKRCHIYFKVWQDNTACFFWKKELEKGLRVYTVSCLQELFKKGAIGIGWQNILRQPQPQPHSDGVVRGRSGAGGGGGGGKWLAAATLSSPILLATIFMFPFMLYRPHISVTTAFVPSVSGRTNANLQKDQESS